MANPDEPITDDTHLPDRCDVWRQVRYDLFETKDVQDTPTFSYTWMADQGGHFSLGFLPTYLFSWILTIVGGLLSFDPSGWNVLIGLFVFCIWVYKERNDYKLALRNAERSKSDFPFNRRELLWNIVTAWLFFAMGSALAALSFVNVAWALISLVPVILITLRVSYWWLRRKITFQQAALPYLYRLATFPNNIPQEPDPNKPPEEPIIGMGLKKAKAFIARMIDPKSKTDDPKSKTDDPKSIWSGHLILSGVANAGKSTLAIGLGTEFVFKLGLCRYLSMVKLLQFSEKQADEATEIAQRKVQPNEEFVDGRVLWRWNKVQLLIVDDVDDIARVQHSGNPNPTPAEVEDYRSRVITALENRYPLIMGDLKSRPRTVWVCNVNPESLKVLLEKILLYKDVQIINLAKTIKDKLNEKADAARAATRSESSAGRADKG